MRALNYILVLENLQVAFFDTGLGNLTAEDFVLAGYNESVYNQLKVMQQQHIVRAPASRPPRSAPRGGGVQMADGVAAPRGSAASRRVQIHNNWLRAVIRARNGTVVEPCAYNFSSLFTTIPPSEEDNSTTTNSTTPTNETSIIQPATFIENAMKLHNLTTEAVLGVIGRLSDPNLVETVASMAVVEGQHGAYLAIIEDEEPFPQPFIDSLTPENVTSVALPYVEDCPFDSLPLPFNRTDVNTCTNSTIVVVPTDSNNPTTNPSSTPTTTGPTASQSAASSAAVTSTLVVALLATIVAAAGHMVAL